jgi:hypothetical protein
MKNPVEHKNHTGLIITLALASVAAAAAAYFYLTDDGEAMREEYSFKLKEGLKDFASGVISGATHISKETVKKMADLLIK